MKKFVFLLFVTFLFTTTTDAQIGIRAGLNLAKVSLDGGSSLGLNSKLAYNVGLNYDISAGVKSSIRVGALFSMKGFKQEIDFIGVVGNANYKFGYFDLPVTYVYHLSGKSKGLFFEGGLNLGYLLTAKAKFDNTTEDFKDELNSIDLGAGLGLGYKIQKNISVGLKYNLGLTNIDKEGSAIKNRVANLNVIYHL